MPIFDNIPQHFYQCADGSYSDHNRTGACNYHGGILSPNAVISIHQQQQAKKRFAGAVWVPIRDISVKKEWFQNRAAPFSIRSVENIMEAVQAGNFKWVNLDPVTLWEYQGKLYMLSGHSRLEAFTRLCRSGATAEALKFCDIPAKIQSNITLEEAKEIALQSNTLSTKETDIERAEYYRRLRQQNVPSREIEQTAKRLEGRNATTILAYSYLNPNGKTFNALAALDNADADSKSIMGKVARWIGNARKNYPQLTDGHENELYDWLITNKGYGTAKGRISAEREFTARLFSIINRRMEFGQLLPTLNIKNTVQLSPVERQYNEQLETARQEVKTLENELRQKIADLNQRGATEAQIQQITEGLEASLRRARIAYQNLLQSKSDVQQAARNELSLFDSLSGIILQ